MGKIADARTIDDLKTLARRRVPKMFFEYADSGAFTEATYRANEEDFAQILLRQKIARPLSNRSLQTQMAGTDVSMPLALSPTGLTGMQHADGEMLAAKAAEAMGVPFTLSTLSICSIEDVKSVTSKPFWFQLYVMRDKAFVKNLMDRAKAAGVTTLVLTMDLQIMSQRHKDYRNGLSGPPKFSLKHIAQIMTKPAWALGMAGTRRHNFRNIVGHVEGVDDMGSLAEWTNKQFEPDLSWKDAEWIRDYWGGRLIIKGVLDAEDARAAAALGADALIVSNHGGRQLDWAPSSIRVLPEIVAAVGTEIEVHIDGGIRSGMDVLKATALGAKGTWIGRPFLYGLGAGGQAGVTRALEIIRDELDTSMGFCGERDIHDVGAHNIYSNGLAPAP